MTPTLNAAELAGRFLAGGTSPNNFPIIVIIKPEGTNTSAAKFEPDERTVRVLCTGGRFSHKVTLVSSNDTLIFKNLDSNPILLFGIHGQHIDQRLFLPMRGSSESVRYTAKFPQIIRWINQSSQETCLVYMTNAPWTQVLEQPGEFRMRNIPEGDYLLTILDLNLGSITQTIQLNSAETRFVAFHRTDNGLSWVE